MVLEVMGRDTGHIALNGGIAGGADIILVPELPYSVAGVARRIKELLAMGRTHALVVVAEGIPGDLVCNREVSRAGHEIVAGLVDLLVTHAAENAQHLGVRAGQ